YRPITSDWITLNKFEYKLKEDTGLATADTRQRKVIDNLVFNFKPDFKNQVSINFGLKHVIDSFDGEEYDGTTVLLGGEYRHDLSKLFDVGLHAHTLNSLNSGINKYSTGVSAGWNMARNVWLSAGYNFVGFDDRDFSAAGYTMHGPYITFRLKFDQDTAKQIQNWLN
ncbi:MAG: YfaZ family outer membrane protein, partial [Gammaproteobacteria bacterium]